MVMLPQDHVVNAMYEAACRERQSPRCYLGMSSIGGPCARALWYGFRGYTPLPPEGRTLMIFDLGDRVEDAVLHWLTGAGYAVTGLQDEYTAHNGFFRGHCDGRISGVTRREHILEIKSANDNRFKAFKTAGVRAVSAAYYCQVQCYMGYSGLERALFVIMNKNTCELYSERVHFRRDHFEALHRRAWDIITANEPPARPGDAIPACAWCDFRFHCREPEFAVQTAGTCGSCTHIRMDGLRPLCRLDPEQPRPITCWGSCCADWFFRDATDNPFTF